MIQVICESEMSQMSQLSDANDIEASERVFVVWYCSNVSWILQLPYPGECEWVRRIAWTAGGMVDSLIGSLARSLMYRIL